MRALAVTVLGIASVALSGCVILANDESESTRIMTMEQAKATTDYAPLRSFNADGRQVQAKVWTTCAGNGDFDVALVDQTYSHSLTIRQRAEAQCQGEARELSLNWTYDVLGLKAGERIVVENQIVL
ncbi:hypothetical protein [Brevundimonas sp.]|uniref:hypothetical protein n=1 Tax=Brevundimonas sp. TaxID=1871086 RepID=UPI002FCA1BEE